MLSRLILNSSPGPRTFCSRRIARTRCLSRKIHNRQMCTSSRPDLQDAPLGERMEFKAETKRLLDIVSKSLYTDKEIFIRELISNASDACEKLKYEYSAGNLRDKSSDKDTTKDTGPFINLRVDTEKNLFVIRDSGIGMSKDEMIRNLGTIAHSGTREFAEKVSTSDGGNNIIGQFGVGFYSSFVVADAIKVISKKACAGIIEENEGLSLSQVFVWESDGLGSFTIRSSMEESDLKAVGDHGTVIELSLKDDCTEFSHLDAVKKAALKFSNFVSVDIFIEGLNEAENKEKLNKQSAVWLADKVSPGQHKDFFQYLSGSSYGSPMYSFLFKTDAPLSIRSVFYVPEDAPSRWFQQNLDVGISLYAKRVLVKKHADPIIPSWLYWVRGVVDCEDMPVNISRETPQDSLLMRKLSTAVVRRILKFLDDESKTDPERYLQFWNKYSSFIKTGLLDDQQKNHGGHKDAILKLLRFYISDSMGLKSFSDYTESISSEQKKIYYFQSINKEAANISPYMEVFKGKKIPVIYLTAEVDSFLMNSIESYNGYPLVSIDSADQIEAHITKEDVRTDSESEKIEKSEQIILQQHFKNLLDKNVTSVKFSDRLVESPAVVTSQISPHMRRMMKNIMSQSGESESSSVDPFGGLPMTLELNSRNNLLKSLVGIIQKSMENTEKDSPEVVKSSKDVVDVLSRQIFDNACIAAGMIEDPRVLLPRLNDSTEKLTRYISENMGLKCLESSDSDAHSKTNKDVSKKENEAETTQIDEGVIDVKEVS